MTLGAPAAGAVPAAGPAPDGDEPCAPGVAAPSREAPPALPAVARVLGALVERGVRHCAWKSNEHLAAALAGLTDIDLLVDRSHAGALNEVLAAHGLKRLVPPATNAHPATEHYLGFDAACGRAFHVHVQYQLVLGEKHVKNYRLPIEQHFVTATREVDGVALPRPELELAVLCTRALLKYRARDVVKDVLRIRSPGVPYEIRSELTWLSAQVDRDAFVSSLAPIGHVVPPAVVGAFLEQFTRAPRSGLAFFVLRSRLRRALRPYRRRPAVAARSAYLHALWRNRRRVRRVPHDGRLLPAAGGLTVAVVGADGSGKSTVSGELERWLGWKLQTRRYYLGSKEPSRRTRVLYLAFRALRRAHRALNQGRDEPARPTRPLAAARDTFLALHHLSIARDRARRIARARRDVQRGRVVVFDRYPLEALSADAAYRALDGPHIASVLRLDRWRLARRLARLEERVYEGFGLPDRLVVLQVDPGVAHARKPDHEPAVIASKSLATASIPARARGHETTVACIDANRSLDTVLADAKATVWDVL